MLLVYVIVVVPVNNPLTTPKLETDALVGFEETQALLEAAVVVAVSVMVSPIPTVVFPEITGKGFTVINPEKPEVIEPQVPVITQ